jgi:hypothetical protein
VLDDKDILPAERIPTNRMLEEEDMGMMVLEYDGAAGRILEKGVLQ